MLILSRQKDESIMIGNNIEITVVDVRGNGVHDDAIHLGIAAPKHISVHREEVYEAIQHEKAKKRAAAKNRGVNNGTGNNPVGISGIDNMDADRGSAQIVELTSGIPA
jgi:carbon storage regulator